MAVGLIKRYCLLLVLPLIAVAGLCASLVAWDPLDIRPWGEPPGLAERPYPLLVRPLLAPTMTRTPKSVVLFGSSTVLAAGSQQLSRLTDGEEVANVAQGQQRVVDSVVVLRNAARTPELDRLVIEVSHIWLFPNEAPLETGKRVIAAFDPDWHSLPSFDREIIEAGLAARSNGVFWNPKWDEEVARFAPQTEVELENWQVAQVRSGLNALGPDAFKVQHQETSCDGLDAIESALEDVIAQAEARRYEVDIFFSAVPFASYPYLALRQRGLFRAYAYEEPFFDRLMALHYCVVSTVDEAGYSLARVHDVNVSTPIVGDLRGMRDPTHYVIPYKFDLIFDHIGLAQRTVTRQNFPAYRRELAGGVRETLGRDLPPSSFRSESAANRTAYAREVKGD